MVFHRAKTITHFMVFHREKHKINKIAIKLNLPIQQVNHTKFLGVVVDNNID